MDMAETSWVGVSVEQESSKSRVMNEDVNHAEGSWLKRKARITLKVNRVLLARVQIASENWRLTRAGIVGYLVGCDTITTRYSYYP